MPTDILPIVIGTLAATGQGIEQIDENTTGADDFAGQLIVFASEVIQAVHDNEDIPPFPPLLQQGTTEKISGNLRVALQIVLSPLQFVSAFLPTKARKIIKYVVQALQALLAGQPVPTAPTI